MKTALPRASGRTGNEDRKAQERRLSTKDCPSAQALAFDDYLDALFRHGRERSVDSWLDSREAYRHWRVLHTAKLRVLMR